MELNSSQTAYQLYLLWFCGFGVWGLGFGVWGLGFGVWGLGFGVWGLGFGVCVLAPKAPRNPLTDDLRLRKRACELLAPI
jgi:hypothetical protein